MPASSCITVSYTNHTETPKGIFTFIKLLSLGKIVKYMCSDRTKHPWFRVNLPDCGGNILLGVAALCLGLAGILASEDQAVKHHS